MALDLYPIYHMQATKDISKTSAITLSNFILKHYGPMSHLKLQKLLYYCEAYHLAYFGDSIINENFQAWIHGPVCREVYNALKGRSILYSDISFDNASNPDEEIAVLTSSQINLISDVLATLSTWQDGELEAATHREQPWITARRGYMPADRCEVEISKEEMMHFYKAEFDKLN